MQRPALFKNRLFIVGVIVLAAMGLLTLLWRHTALAEIVTPENTIEWMQGISQSWWAPLVILAAYTPACIVMFPRPLITLAAVVAYGPWLGGALAMAGIEIASTAGYFAGRLIEEKKLHRWAGPRFEHVSRFLKRRGLFATTTVRLLPVAPFIVVSAVAGAVRVRLWHLIGGTFIGMFPGMFGTTVLGDQVAEALSTGNINWWIVAAVVAALATLGFFTRRWMLRLERKPI